MKEIPRLHLPRVSLFEADAVWEIPINYQIIKHQDKKKIEI